MKLTPPPPRSSLVSSLVEDPPQEKERAFLWSTPFISLERPPALRLY